MTWPAPDLPFDFQNATISADTHPSAHNDTNLSLNDDYRPEIIRLGDVVIALGLGSAPDVGKNNTPGASSFEKAAFPNLVFVRVMMGGGGGGGGGAGPTQAAEAAAGAGGGGGGYCETIILAADLAVSEPYTVGAGGNGGSGSNPGLSGTSSSGFGLSADPGQGGTGAGGVAFEFANQLPGNGGGTSGTRTLFKNGLTGGTPTSPGQRNFGGPGGASMWGYGGGGGNAITAVGQPGVDGTLGQGGGGAANRPSQGTTRSGGDGGNGFVWIESWSKPPA